MPVSMPRGMVFKIKKYALHDGPGIRTTVFFKGCPLSCWWCHNPEGISPEPQVLDKASGIPVGTLMSADQVMAEIEKDILFYDQSGGGVTLSGGEPLMQPLFAETLLKACRRSGIHTAIDTSGYVSGEIFERLSQQADMILFDIKLADTRRHRHYTGVPNELIFDNLKALCRTHTQVIARVPVIPTITGSIENLTAIARLLKDCRTLRRVDLLPYHRIADQKYRRLNYENKMDGIQPPGADELAAARRVFEDQGLSVSIGG